MRVGLALKSYRKDPNFAAEVLKIQNIAREVRRENPNYRIRCVGTLLWCDIGSIAKSVRLLPTATTIEVKMQCRTCRTDGTLQNCRQRSAPFQVNGNSSVPTRLLENHSKHVIRLEVTRMPPTAFLYDRARDFCLASSRSGESADAHGDFNGSEHESSAAPSWTKKSLLL